MYICINYTYIYIFIGIQKKVVGVYIRKKSEFRRHFVNNLLSAEEIKDLTVIAGNYRQIFHPGRRVIPAEYRWCQNDIYQMKGT